MMYIPKNIHISWNDKNIINSDLSMITNGLKKLIELNKDWTVTVSDDRDIDNYLKNNLDSKDYLLIKDIHIVSKVDIWRLFKLYNEGGLYMDLDRLCNISLSDIITDDIKCVLPTCLDMDFSQDLMLSMPQNPIYLKTIELMMQRRWQGHRDVYYLGPQTYMHAVTLVLMGEIINSNPGIEIFTEIRKTLDSMPFIKTYRETPPYDTILYRDDGNISDWQSMKIQLYHSYNLHHWTNDF